MVICDPAELRALLAKQEDVESPVFQEESPKYGPFTRYPLLFTPFQMNRAGKLDDLAVDHLSRLKFSRTCPPTPSLSMEYLR